jgi:hypothetical protein
MRGFIRPAVKLQSPPSQALALETTPRVEWIAGLSPGTGALRPREAVVLAAPTSCARLSKEGNSLDNGRELEYKKTETAGEAVRGKNRANQGVIMG